MSYFESLARRQYQEPWSRLPIIFGGVFIALAGLFVITHDTPKGSTWIVMGLGMALYGAALIYMQDSRWRFLALTVGVAAWFGAVYEMIRLTFIR